MEVCAMGSVRKREDTGLLFIDFRYRGQRCREQTALPDSAANRKKVQKVLDRIEADIASGIFEYRRYFPSSKNAAKFDVVDMPPAGHLREAWHWRAPVQPPP